ncbi:hypothetical protein ACFXOK_15125 [Streptomyces sp. NPDC059173]|uniref:hypothetical protein n=1 Tax=Streptomyces sp. NPDC059173 TaxID=3346756 RepID=UPI00369C44BE
MNSRNERARTIAIVLMLAVILAFLAGLLANVFHRDPVEWGAWTFTTVSTLGLGITFALWSNMP